MYFLKRPALKKLLAKGEEQSRVIGCWESARVLRIDFVKFIYPLEILIVSDL